MVHLSDDELGVVLDAIDLCLQGADDAKQLLFSDKYLMRLEDLLRLAAAHDDMVVRLKRARQELEEERDRRRRTAYSA